MRTYIKFITIMLIIISSVMITGQTCTTQANVDVNEIKNEGECRNHPDAVWFDGKCWYDTNHDGYADDLISKDCNEYCNINDEYCKEEDQRVWYECQIIDNCYKLERMGITINKCGVECLDNKNCRRGKNCVDYKCENEICGDNQCDMNTENCTCVDCPVSIGHKCCNGTDIAGNCCSNEECNTEETCKNNVCTPILKCGDGICSSEIGENCDNCSTDCKPTEGFICCSGSIIVGNCCLNENCTSNEVCTNNTCISLVQLPESNQTENITE